MKKWISLLLAVLTASALATAAFASSMGGVVKPNENGDNTVTFGNDNVTYAKLSFKADSDAEKFYVELSTDWDDCAYGADFYDLDAYLYAFTVNPSIPATSAPTLLLYNRFVDEDGELTVKPGDVTIYQVKKTGLTDVTSSFTATETGDGDPVFAIRTRRARHLCDLGAEGGKRLRRALPPQGHRRRPRRREAGRRLQAGLRRIRGGSRDQGRPALLRQMNPRVPSPPAEGGDFFSAVRRKTRQTPHSMVGPLRIL